MISSSTRLTGLFGHPVSHSKSPQMHNAAFAHLGLDFAYLAFDVAPEQVQAAVHSIRALGLRGVNVTIPHKVAVMPHLDAVSEEAQLIGAVNTIVNEAGRLIGYNTDGIGYITALQEETGFAVAGKKVLLIGAGGAARAVAGQMALSGAGQLTIAARDREKAQELADHLAAFAATNGCTFGEAEETASAYDLIVNTTPIGMHPHVEQVPFDTSRLQAEQLVSDLIYNPRETRFLQEAALRGCRTHGGL
ncbi:MAG: shikimate dehydrogenase, partial [Tumebacillaceae bacterium]